jgi:hypothetical protein
MNIIRFPRLMLLLCLFTTQQTMAGEKGSYQSWNNELNGKTNEAYTVADPKTSFGIFCSGEQCMS